jgi:hypothetical protein
MKVALLVGIDDYPKAPLSGCVNDARRMCETLARNDDFSPNFHCYSLLSSERHVTRAVLRENLEKLLAQDFEIALFYFAGHGYLDGLGGYLVTQDTMRYDEGVAMADVLALANRSKCREVTIVLDCCHSGAFGQVPHLAADHALLGDGVSVLCASRSTEYAVESNGSGLFTSLLAEALTGGAASLTGEVTVASAYAFVERNMGAWDQRPLFKASLSRLHVLRQCDPLVDLTALRLLPVYFESADQLVQLVPAASSSSTTSDKARAQIAHFRAFRSAGLVQTPAQGALDEGGAVILTSLGRYYWRVAKEQRI